MKKRILAFLLAVSIAVSMLVLPASAAGNANTAVQLSITLNAMDSSQQAALNAVVTRGALARMLVSYSTYRESVGSQGTVGTLFTDLPGTSPYAPYVRIAVQNGWMNGYTDGSFRPDNAVTLEEAVTAILKLMGYKMTDLSGSFPNAQLNKASELGLRNQVDRSQGEVLNYEECALLFYNALTANAASGSAYGSSLGFTVSNGQVDTSSVMLKSLKGPFVAGDTVQLPFVPKMVYRNDKASESAELNKYDVYYYSESLQTLWVYTRRAAGRITAVSPSASAPTSVTVAGTSYTLGSSAVASQVSSLNGGGVGEVVTLLLGMNNEAAGIVTGEEADSVFYGVVQTATRSLVEENGADVLQKVSVMCTDGIARTVNVDKSLNFPQGWLVEIKVTPEGESVEHIEDRRVNGTINANATALGAAALADDVEILDTTSEGVAGTVRPSRLSGVTLSDLDVRYYTVNDAGQIDRALLGVVEQPARRRHDEIDAAAQALDLRVDAHPAEDHGAAHAQMPTVGLDRFDHLGGQFARRHQHQRSRRPRRTARKTVQDGQYEGRRLAGAGLGGGEHVATLEHQRDGLRLDRRGFGVAGVSQGAQQLGRKAEVLKTHAGAPETPSRAHRRLRGQSDEGRLGDGAGGTPARCRRKARPCDAGLRNGTGRGRGSLVSRFKWRARKDSNLRPPGS